jgi:hypothetical protein
MKINLLSIEKVLHHTENTEYIKRYQYTHIGKNSNTVMVFRGYILYLLFFYGIQIDLRVNRKSLYFLFLFTCLYPGYGNDDLPWLNTQPLQNIGGANVCIVLGK